MWAIDPMLCHLVGANLLLNLVTCLVMGIRLHHAAKIHRVPEDIHLATMIIHLATKMFNPRVMTTHHVTEMCLLGVMGILHAIG